MVYECLTCKFSTPIKCKYQRHLETKKHLTLVKQEGEMESDLRKQIVDLKTEIKRLTEINKILINQSKQATGQEEVKFNKNITIDDIKSNMRNDMFYKDDARTENHIDNRTDKSVITRTLSNLDFGYIFVVYLLCVEQRDTLPLCEYIKKILGTNYSVVEDKIFVEYLSPNTGEIKTIELKQENGFLKMIGMSLVNCYKYYREKVQRMPDTVKQEYEQECNMTIWNGYVDWVDDVIFEKKDGSKTIPYLKLDFLLQFL